jgi:hypothetical protein
MKDLKVYDGAGWQSLKGPPGPSAPSADAGNLITVGSDGLLMVKGETQFSGSWTPSSSEDYADGYWTRSGRAVTLTILLELPGRFPGDPSVGFSISDTPFSVAEFYDANLSSATAQFSAPVIRADDKVIGVATMLSDGSGSVGVRIYEDVSYDRGAACISITYLTDDARLG